MAHRTGQPDYRGCRPGSLSVLAKSPIEQAPTRHVRGARTEPCALSSIRFGKVLALPQTAAPHERRDMLARRTFTMADQLRYATISGDRNPMHLDAVLARRTQAAVPVVHGIHLLLWTLDVLALASFGQPPIRRLTARFNRFVTIDEMVTLVIAKRNEVNSRFDLVLDLVMAGLTVAQIMAASAHPPVRTRSRFSAKPFPPPGGTVQFDIRARGRAVSEARLGEQPASVAAIFPSASVWLGSCRVAALVGSCLLVGMVCPGLHSIYGSLAVDTYDEQDPDGGARLPGNAGCPALPRGTVAHCGWWAGRYGREFIARAASAASVVE